VRNYLTTRYKMIPGLISAGQVRTKLLCCSASRRALPASHLGLPSDPTVRVCYGHLTGLISAGQNAAKTGFPFVTRGDVAFPGEPGTINSATGRADNTQYIFLNDTLVAPIYANAGTVHCRLCSSYTALPAVLNSIAGCSPCMILISCQRDLALCVGAARQLAMRLVRGDCEGPQEHLVLAAVRAFIH